MSIRPTKALTQSASGRKVLANTSGHEARLADVERLFEEDSRRKNDRDRRGGTIWIRTGRQVIAASATSCFDDRSSTS